EETAFDQRNVHGRPIVGSCGGETVSAQFVERMAFDGEGGVGAASGEGQTAADGRMGDAGNGAERGDQTIDKRDASGVVLVVLPRQGELSGQYLVGVEARRGFEESLQADAEQAG